MKQVNDVVFVLILLTTVSCTDNQDNLVKQEVPVDIYESTIPPTGTINQDIQIQLRAQATNGCYSDLKIEVKEIDDRHFLFKAAGLFKSNGICPDIMVYGDTIITFRPTSTGSYFFQTNEPPFEIKKDTININ